MFYRKKKKHVLFCCEKKNITVFQTNCQTDIRNGEQTAVLQIPEFSDNANLDLYGVQP